MRELAVRMHADAARMAELVCAFADGGEWRRAGVRSCADWVMANLGFDRYTTDKLLRAGVAARQLPAVAEAFSAGELSLDTVGMLSSVATAEDQGAWVEVARESSPPQLARRCREAHRAALIDAPDRARAQRAQRGLRSWWDDLGMLQLRGALPPEEGARFRLSLERRRAGWPRSGRRIPIPPTIPPPRCAPTPWSRCAPPGTAAGVRRPRRSWSCTSTSVCSPARPRRGAATSSTVPPSPPRRRGGWAATPPWSPCSSATGRSVGGGPERPGVTLRMRRAVQGRDGTCRYPGCAIPATRTDAHHIHHRIDGGPTRLWNLLSLCEYHHNRHHDGEYDIRRTAGGDLCFETHDGLLVGTATGGCWRRSGRRAGTP